MDLEGHYITYNTRSLLPTRSVKAYYMYNPVHSIVLQMSHPA